MDDKTIFYIIGGTLAVMAVVVSFVGIRNKEFPPEGPTGRLIIALFAVFVVGAAAFAVLGAREEQGERREHLAEAEPEAVETGSEEQLAEEEEAGDEAAGDAQVEEEEQPADEGGDELETQGADVFTANGCASCHTLAAASATGTVGPDLDETLASKDTAYIEAAIVDPDAELAEGFEAGVMPATFGDDISPADIEALVAYLEFAVSQS